MQPPLNAFNVLMASVRDAIGKDIPKPVHDPKSNMDRLRNKVLSHFEEKGCIFSKNSGKGAVHLSQGCVTCCTILMANIVK